MKKLILLFILVAIIFVVMSKHRLYVRDPLGSVARNGMKESGAQVFINFDNDVLVENDNAPMYVELVQHERPIGTPAHLTCMHWVACLLDADQPTLIDQPADARIESMSSKTVTFMDSGKRETVVALR